MDISSVDLKVAALSLARKGTPVFPLLEKRPVNKNGFHGATTNRDEICQFDWSRADGIGGAISPGVFVVDIDPRHDGDQTIRALGEAGLALPSTLVHTTGGGGTHRFYKLPPSARESRLRGKLGPGVDIKASGKGYIVVPPTPGYSVTEERPVAEAPEWMVKELVKTPAPEKETSFGSLPKFFDVFEVGTPYGTAAMEREIGRLLMTPVGSRNDALNKSSFALGQLSAGGELKAEEALARLLEAGRALTDNEAEIAQTIESGWEAGLLEPREASSQREPYAAGADADSNRPDEFSGNETEALGEEHYWLDWEGADDTPPPFFLHPLVPKDAYIIAYGATESSKSIVLLALCALASKRGLKTSIMSLENPPHVDIDRIRRLQPDPRNFRLTNQPLDLNDARQVHKMVERESKWPDGGKTDWLVIDTYSHAFNTRTEDGNQKAIEFSRRVRYIMKAVGCTVILVDHTGYSDHGEPRDASAKRQAVDVALKFSKVGKWIPGQPSRFSIENCKSARFGNPAFLRGRIEDCDPGRGLQLGWDAGHEPVWSDEE